MIVYERKSPKTSLEEAALILKVWLWTKLIVQSISSGTRWKIALKLMPQNLTNQNSTLVQVSK